MRKRLSIFILGGMITALTLIMSYPAHFEQSLLLIKLNNICYDYNLKLFHNSKRTDQVVIVDIDDQSLAREGHWPWSRDKLAHLVEQIFKAGAVVIGFDILFPESEPNLASSLLLKIKRDKKASPAIQDYLNTQVTAFDNDKIFAQAIAQQDVVLGEFFSPLLEDSNGQLGSPLPYTLSPHLKIFRANHFIGNNPELAQAAKYVGFTTTNPDRDGVIRRSPLLLEYQAKIYPSLALEMLKAYLMTENIAPSLTELGSTRCFLGVMLDKLLIPTDPSGSIFINYRGPGFSFKYLSASQVLHEQVNKRELEGKLVLIGSSAVGLGDLHSSPLQAATYPGVEIHANILASILDRQFLSSPLWLLGLEKILILLLGLLIAILAACLSASSFILLASALLLITYLANILVLVKFQLILPHPALLYLQIGASLLVNSLYGYLFETKNRKKLHEIYGQYVSASHIEQMMKLPNQHTLLGNTKEMTVLFTDVRNFTSISEKLEAKDVKRLLNTLFTPLTEIIFEHKGTIDKYVGDLIMAFWNDPLTDPNHAQNCVKAALSMQRKVADLAQLFAAQGIPPVAIRIGINTGLMHVGDMGSKYRKAYTVLGDAVNLASRLEGTNKFYGTKILVSGETKSHCPEVTFRFVDRISVKGKNEATEIYEPLVLTRELTAELQQELTAYQNVMTLYEQQNWPAAESQFATLTRLYPKTELYRVYLARVQEYKKNPPSASEAMVQHLTAK